MCDTDSSFWWMVVKVTKFPNEDTKIGVVQVNDMEKF